MKFRVERDVLADAVSWAARTLPARPAMPLLTGLLVEVADDGLVLSGFDYETSARAELAADVDEPGRTLVPGRLLADIAKSLPAKPVSFALEGTRIAVTCGRSSFLLPTMAVEDYPILPPMPDSAGTIAGATFADAVAKVAVAAGRDDTLPTLTGIRVEIDDSVITLAATDRYRLAVRDVEWSPRIGGLQAQVLIPARVLSDTAKSLAHVDVVELALGTGTGEGLMGFQGEGRRTTTRLLDGEFPKYRSLLPAEAASVATVETAALVEAVKRVALVAERSTPVRLDFSADEVVLRAGTGDEAQASESCEAVLDGDPIGIAFNPHYLLDGLGAVGAATTRLSFTVASRPAVLTGVSDGDDADDYRYLLMPVRLTG